MTCGVLAFMLGPCGGGPPTLDGVSPELCLFATPIVTLVCVTLVTHNRRWYGYSMFFATAFAIVMLAPFTKVLWNAYGRYFDGGEFMMLLYSIGFPYLAVLVQCAILDRKGRTSR